MSGEEELVDPDVLAAIEASKAETEQLEDDPMIKAALEESMRETGDSGDHRDSESNENTESNGDYGEPLKENGNSSTAESNETEEDKAKHNSDEERNAETEEAKEGTEETDRESEDKDKSEAQNDDDSESKDKSENDENDVTTNGHGEGEKSKADVENNGTSTKAADIKLEGEAVTGDANGNDEGDNDNDEEEIGVKRSRKKRKRSLSGSDDEEDETYGKSTRKSLRPRGKGSKAIVFRCSYCTFNTEILGELVIHKYTCHKGQPKPSYLDMAEIAVYSKGSHGARKEKVLEILEQDYSEYLNSDRKQSKQMLSRALEGGVSIGRLRKGGKGNQVYFMVGKEKRKALIDKWKVNKRSLEYKDVKSIEQGSKEYFEIQRQLNKLNILMSGGGSSRRERDDDDDICVVEEKITDKARRRAEHRKRLIAQKKKQLAQQRALAAKNAGPKTVIKVNSPQGKLLLKKIAASGSVPSALTKGSSKPTKKFDDEDDEASLTCPVCLSTYWYPNQKDECHQRCTNKTAHIDTKAKSKAMTIKKSP